MPFKKLHADIQEKLSDLDITLATPFQTKAIPVIKSGANVFCSGPTDIGKTTTLILTILHKLKCTAVGNAPRAIVLVKNKEKATELYDLFLKYTKHNSLRVYLSHEELHIDLQKSEIFEGLDILISTPVTLNKLLLANGLSVSQLKIFSVDDAGFLTENAAYTALLSITRGIKKCQFVLYSEKLDPKLKRFENSFMEYSKKISV
ncbi:DEAD/DEAH box helicase [Aquimarina sp. Aq107]|uniref:DEAD/DEAH box helicase n=1 Tax=Aquimarina sp. Aq107 TaxID=1191912 RepID=UPI000D560FD3|nr:DEAD/DEAH box helicase [Aquimarina sp. Aq107]